MVNLNDYMDNPLMARLEYLKESRKILYKNMRHKIIESVFIYETRKTFLDKEIKELERGLKREDKFSRQGNTSKRKYSYKV